MMQRSRPFRIMSTEVIPLDTEPEGELVIRTIAMPKDTNFNGDIFGGWLLAQMDLGGAIAARKLSRSRITTVAIDSMRFRHPVHVGDTVCCHAKLERVGTTSMTYKIIAWVNPMGISEQRCCVTEALFTYVAIDKDGKPIPVIRKAEGSDGVALDKLPKHWSGIGAGFQKTIPPSRQHP